MKRLLTPLLILCHVSLFAQHNFIEIFGTWEGPPGGPIKLFFEGEVSKKDSLQAEVKEGRFYFKLLRSGPVLANFHMGDSSAVLDVYVEGPRTTIHIIHDTVGEQAMTGLRLKSVSGSPTETLKQSFVRWHEQLLESGLPAAEINERFYQQLYQLMEANPQSKAGPYLLGKGSGLSLKQVDALKKLIAPTLWQSWEVKQIALLVERLTRNEKGNG